MSDIQHCREQGWATCTPYHSSMTTDYWVAYSVVGLVSPTAKSLARVNLGSVGRQWITDLVAPTILHVTPTG